METNDFYNTGKQREYDLYCRHCFETSTKGNIDGLIAKGDNVYLLRANESSLHLSCGDPMLTYKTHIRPHYDHENHGIKPFAIFCLVCENQLGVMMRDENTLFPSFHHSSVMFLKGDEIMHTKPWKSLYASGNKKVRMNPIGCPKPTALISLTEQNGWKNSKIESVRISKFDGYTQHEYHFGYTPKTGYTAKIKNQDASMDVTLKPCGALYPKKRPSYITDTKKVSATDDWKRISRIPKKYMKPIYTPERKNEN